MFPENHPSIYLSQLLYSTSRQLIQQIQQALNEVNLTYPQFLTMNVLWKEDGLKVHQLGLKLQLDSGTLTPLLKKLEAQNLVKRKRGEEDERTVRVHLTYPGKSLQQKTMEALASLEFKLSEDFGKEISKMIAPTEALFKKLNP